MGRSRVFSSPSSNAGKATVSETIRKLFEVACRFVAKSSGHFAQVWPADPNERQVQTRRHWQVFCYARPNHPRNAFDVLCAAMRRLKARLGERVQIVAAGDHFDVAALGLAGIIENRGVLSYEETAELYRASDIGIALMLTRHPSYIPLELMASGCLVVTNRNHWTEWLLEHEQNCILAEPTATCLAETIERALRDEALRRRITDNALALVRDRYSNWDREIQRVFDYICDPDNTAAQLSQSGEPSEHTPSLQSWQSAH
jgi:glycosyltransferase involved in cell wall biosynthesis